MGLRARGAVLLWCCCAFIFLLSFIALLNDAGTGRIAAADSPARRSAMPRELGEQRRLEEEVGMVGEGPGSFPPRCTSKCGDCTPCRPVHVPVPPGTPVTTEYYPEAWRCKCRNRLYMP